MVTFKLLIARIRSPAPLNQPDRVTDTAACLVHGHGILATNDATNTYLLVASGGLLPLVTPAWADAAALVLAK